MKAITLIEEGVYQVNSSIKITIDNTLKFYLGNNYIITGENGVGKSTFISKLLIPNAIKCSNENFLIFYASQDFTIQYYVVKYYYNGLLFENNDFSSIEKVITFIKEKFVDYKKFPTQNIVFIVDEIDQYLPIERFLKGLNSSNYSVFLSTHNKCSICTSLSFEDLIFEKVSREESKIYLNNETSC
jgi:hypothetical protein